VDDVEELDADAGERIQHLQGFAIPPPVFLIHRFTLG
jgi:hypothetical protein